MNFQDLHELLRLELLGRIESGDLTGTALARQSNFKQAHISNFLHGKRALSLEGLDRVLAAQGLTVDQLMPLEQNQGNRVSSKGLEGGFFLRKNPLGGLASANAYPGFAGELSASGEPGSRSAATAEMEAIPVVTTATAINEPVVRPGAVIETVLAPAAALKSNRWWAPEKYVRWQRYVAVRADAQQAAAMAQLIVPGAVVVLDRHYRSLAAYRPQLRTLYAVRTGAGLALRHVELDGENLVLRPLALTVPVQVLTPGPQETPADYIVGRVCVVVAEL